MAALVTLTPPRTHAADRHVDPASANPQPPYSNWITAAHTIQDALHGAPAGDVIHVAAGIYDTGGEAIPGQSLTNRVTITNAVTVRSVGGPLATAIIGRSPVGDTAIRCAFVDNGGQLSGFTLLGGHTRAGSGLWQPDCSGGGVLLLGGTVSDCILHSNAASYGGGAFVAGGLLTRCIISSNTATLSPSSGGGVYCADQGEVRDCDIIGNTARYGAGAFCDANGIVRQCGISNNVATYNGGGSFCGPTGILLNCHMTENEATRLGGGTHLWKGGNARGLLMHDNSANVGGGVYCDRGGMVEGCTIVVNSGATAGGGASSFFGGYYQNSIITFNDAPNAPNLSYAGEGHGFSYCCTAPLAPGEGNIADNPAFIDLPGENFRLHSYSPCIDSGINKAWMTTVRDIDRRPRIWINVVDIGAYEFNPADVNADTDGDGMPDGWEWDHFGHVTNTLPTDDGDFDFFTAFEECVAGTHPADDTSYLYVAGRVGTEGEMIVTWPSVTGRYYTLARITNLPNQATSAPLLVDTPATPPMNTYTDAVGALDVAVYKLRVRNELP